MKKLLTLLLAAIMVLSTLTIGITAADANAPKDYVPVDAADTTRYNAASKWDGTVYTVTELSKAYTFEGAGTKESPWLIKSADDLAKLSANVRFSNETTNYEGKYFKLTCDINMQHKEWWGIGGCFIDGVKWGADASKANLEMFAGVFLGDSHVIYNFNLAGKSADGKYMCANGLFGYAGKGAEIHDLGIVNGDISMTNASRIGALIGASRYDLTVKNCFNRANLTFVYEAGVKCSDNRAPEARVGGLMGAVMNDNTTERNIENCYNSGNVTVTLAEGIAEYAVGGIAGYLSDGLDNIFTNCVNTGTITVNANHGAAPNGGRITCVASLVGNFPWNGFYSFIDCKAGGAIVYNNTNAEASGMKIASFVGFIPSATALTFKGTNEYSVVIDPDVALGNHSTVADGKVTKVDAITLTYKDNYFMGAAPAEEETTTPEAETTTAEPETTTAPEDETTKKADVTTAPEGDETTVAGGSTTEKDGCGSTISMSALFVLLLIGGVAAICARKAKKENA